MISSSSLPSSRGGLLPRMYFPQRTHPCHASMTDALSNDVIHISRPTAYHHYAMLFGHDRPAPTLPPPHHHAPHSPSLSSRPPLPKISQCATPNWYQRMGGIGDSFHHFSSPHTHYLSTSPTPTNPPPRLLITPGRRRGYFFVIFIPLLSLLFLVTHFASCHRGVYTHL